MKISPNWLRDFVDLKVDEQELARELTMHGTSVEGISGTGAQTVYEVEFTSNRPDAMNHYGVARECSAIFDIDLKPLSVKLPGTGEGTCATQAGEGAGRGQAFPIIIEDAGGCARYTARVMRGVKIGPSPARIAERLESVEQRSINNVADASNYTLWEMGHPTHAFDLDTLEGGKIIIRRAREGEALKTLDGVERKLSKEDLVIADAVKPVALAGVMGGFDTMITEKTRNVLIESAWFDPISVRKTSKRHGLHTDASHRFERGADWGITPVACARVAQLILESAGGKLEGGEIDAVARKIGNPPVQLRHSEVRRVLGQDIGDSEISCILRRLGFGVTADPVTTHRQASVSGAPYSAGGARAAIAEEPGAYTVEIPTWRLDVEREIDVIEEIARIYGYDRFPNTLPSFAGGVEELPDESKDARMRSTLLALGYNEALTLTFVSKEEAKAFAVSQPVEIANPMSDEAAYMRTSLVPGMLGMLAWNLNRGTNDARLFEAGRVYEKIGERTEEHKRIAIGATGNAMPASVHGAARPYTFFDLKGDIEALLSAFEYRTLYFDAHAADYFHPGRSARAVMDGATVARFGQIHPDVAAARKIKQDVYVAELYLERLYQRVPREPAYKPVPRYPAVDRDFSFIFDDAVTFERIRTAVDALRLPELTKFWPVEIFRGGAVSKGKYSVLLRAEFQSAERTLRDDEVALWATQIIKALEALGGTLRA
jgi:phenylalanyl-tRNA synthetase beta chain